MRFVGVVDPARSILFYRDVLGFELRERSGVIEAVSGPAQIQLGGEDCPPPGASVVFFETDNLDAMRAAICARGGKPSEFTKVNRVKMRVFEIRDPDGNTLWFGESYDRPVREVPVPMMLKALPQLPVGNVAAAVAHYRDVLGFHVNHQQDDLGVMDRDRITVLLIPRTERHAGIGSAYIYVEDADALFTELRANGANLGEEPVSHPWGLRDFGVLDPDGNQLRFGQPFE